MRSIFARRAIELVTWAKFVVVFKQIVFFGANETKEGIRL